MKPRDAARVLSIFGLFLLSPTAWAWFAEGHEVVAIIAADDLTPTARSHVAQILSVPDDTGSIEKAMAAASIRLDTEFRDEDRTTASWHYIDIWPARQRNRHTSAVPRWELRHGENRRVRASSS
jgi:hypothetical protein